MKQGTLRGFGHAHLTGATPPTDMTDDVVTLCATSPQPEAAAIRLSIKYAKRRFGYRQIDIARMCGWKKDNHLSSYAKGAASMPEKHFRKFAQVTGCNLLEQVQQRLSLTDHLAGRDSPNKRDEAALMQMLAVAA